MKRFFILIFLGAVLSCSLRSQVIIPSGGNFTPGSWFCFRTKVFLDKLPRQRELRLAADTKYWLWINGELVMSEGGLKRGPNPTDTYCDVIGEDRLPLTKGENTVAVLVWYFGKDGFSHRNSPTPGIWFELKCDNEVFPLKAESWRTLSHPAYYVPEGEEPNFRLPESNIGFDASRDIPFMKPDFDDSAWPIARSCALTDAGWNKLVDRPIPFWKDYGLKKYERIERCGDTIKAYLPYNAQITPYIRLRAEKGRVIRIETDNYRGGSAPNVFAEYKTVEGDQNFECLGWMNGHCVYYMIPEGVEVEEVQYRETGYDTRLAGSFLCDDPRLNTLWNKAQRTLYLTMRDTYMDCPDRERAQWWGDVVNELGEAFYALDEKAHLLTRKGIRELMDWQRADSTIYAPVPAGNYHDELPMQMLASVGYYGFWTYYMGTEDRQTIEYVFPKVKKYIHVWKTGADHLVIPRKGGWTWGDWGDHKDMELLFNQWYILALDGYTRMAELVGDKDEAIWAERTADTLRDVFHRTYWNGQYYASPACQGDPDDRAQALAVVSGTLPDTLYSVIRPIFQNVRHASPYMEKYVLEALCRMGYYQDALDRMKLRYDEMIKSQLTTLWEGWGIGSQGFGGGTYNHAWGGGPLTIMSQYIAGIAPVEPAFKTFVVSPHPAYLNRVQCVVPLKDRQEIRMTLDKGRNECLINLYIPEGYRAQFVPPVGYNRWLLNGTVCRTWPKYLKSGIWKITGVKTE